MIWVYMAPGVIMFLINIAVFTHTKLIEDYFDLDLSEVDEIKFFLNHVPAERQFLAAALMTVAVVIVFFACLLLWPALIAKVIMSKGEK